MKKYILFFVSSTCFITANLTAQTITKVAGKTMSKFGYGGDGGSALLAELPNPRSIAFDTSGNLYFTDYACNRIRKIDKKGIIQTVVGSGDEYQPHSKTTWEGLVGGYSGDGSSARSARLYGPEYIVFDNQNNIYFSDQNGTCIRKVSAATGIITTIVGDGIRARDKDGSNINDNNDDGIDRKLSEQSKIDVRAMAIDKGGNLYVTERYLIRKINISAGTITTVAGTGQQSFHGVNGDGGLATNSALYYPSNVAFDNYGNWYFAESGNNVLRKVNKSGIISTIAGVKIKEGYDPSEDIFPPNGALAKATNIPSPMSLVIDNSGDKYFLSKGKISSSSDYTKVLLKIDQNGVVKKILDLGDGQLAATDKKGNLYFFTEYSFLRYGVSIYKISLK